MAGISEIDTQYSGLQLEYVQLMTVTGQGVINVKVSQKFITLEISFYN